MKFFTLITTYVVTYNETGAIFLESTDLAKVARFLIERGDDVVSDKLIADWTPYVMKRMNFSFLENKPFSPDDSDFSVYKITESRFANLKFRVELKWANLIDFINEKFDRFDDDFMVGDWEYSTSDSNTMYRLDDDNLTIHLHNLVSDTFSHWSFEDIDAYAVESEFFKGS